MHDETENESVSTDADRPTTTSVETRPRHPGCPSFVYFIQCNGPDGPIKIGRASDVKKRLHALQSGNPYELALLGHARFDDAAFVEGGLHGAFEKFRIRGEWFRCDPVILEVARDASTAYQRAAVSWMDAPRLSEEEIPIMFKKPTPKRKRPEPTGAIVTGTDPCTCGHAPEEHGRDPAHPGSTACRVEIDEPHWSCCGCMAYEADPEAA